MAALYAYARLGYVDPLIRQMTLYRDLIEKRTRQENDLMNGRLAPPRHSGSRAGAPVASLRCRILRAGVLRI